MRLFRGVRGRGAIAGVVAMVAVGGAVLVGLDQGNDVDTVRLLSGSAWFASAKVGQITLLDGASAEVSAQVRVAEPGDALSVVQQGATAYTVDQTTGTVRRVDGVNFVPTAPSAPIADVRGSALSLVAGPSTVYALDTTRGLLAAADPKTLDRRGGMLSVASRLAAGTVTVDDTGTLWAVDVATGDVDRVIGQDKTIRTGVVKPGNSVITIADGHPVIVDPTDRKAVSIDRDTGRVTGTFALDLRPDDKFQVSGSAHTERIYVVAARGVLDVCDLAKARCDNAIPLTAGSDFGPAVEAGDRVFVPDYTTGQVWVINLRDSRVIAKPTVLKPNVRFQLMTRDGVVFYNDTNSEDAGVVQVDGSLTRIKKYDRNNPDKGVVDPNHGDGSQPSAPAPPSGPVNDPKPSGVVPSDNNNPQNPNQPQAPNDPQVPDNPQNPSVPTGPTEPSNPAAPLKLQIVVDKATPTVDEPITLTVTDASGVAPKSAHWTYGDGDVNDGVTTNHKWAKARPAPYIVAVEVTMPDGRQGTTSVNITVSEIPRFRLTVNPSAGGTVSGGGIQCPATCFVDLAKDVQITLTATPDAGHLAGSWGDGCHGTSTACDVRMGTAPISVTYTFTPKPEPPVRLSVASPANGSVSGGGIQCPGKCFVDVPKGTRITLTATPAAGFVFGTWTGDCSGAACSVTMDGPHTVSATFTPAPFKVDVVNQYDRVASHHAWVDVSDGHNCTSACHYTIPRNSGRATLTFTAGVGIASFKGWVGECAFAGTSKTCTITLDHDISVGAKFAPLGG
ncbi:hypothetical protein [Actinocrispum sp. NPDC049592]|uniref:InlB B-repeat-containing protein n=1 Tax=Actinocrispum sp. NPDC049592 TaxID=3154835 RepID=UPI00342FC205